MIADLAQQKDFLSLTPAERAEVLAEMSQEEYDQWRKVLLTAREMEARVQPPTALRNRLMEQMATRKPGGATRLLAAKMPVWQAAAALLLAVAAVIFMKKEPITERIVTEWQVRVDTVFQERVVWRDRVVIQYKMVDKPEALPMAFSSERIDSQSVAPVFQEVELTGAHIGTSLGDTPELVEFFTQGK